MGGVKYFVSAPNSVQKVAEQIQEKLKKRSRRNLKNVKELDKCKFVLVFCPIVSRTGTDIDAKLNEIQRDFENKSVILIVLHHTFDPESIVSDSRKFVERNEPTLTLDVLFHEDKGLLKCKKNSEALKDAEKWIRKKNYKTDDSTNNKGTKNEGSCKAYSGASQL